MNRVRGWHPAAIVHQQDCRSLGGEAVAQRLEHVLDRDGIGIARPEGAHEDHGVGRFGEAEEPVGDACGALARLVDVLRPIGGNRMARAAPVAREFVMQPDVP